MNKRRILGIIVLLLLLTTLARFIWEVYRVPTYGEDPE